jgi:hypothetical protein
MSLPGRPAKRPRAELTSSEASSSGIHLEMVTPLVDQAKFQAKDDEPASLVMVPNDMDDRTHARLDKLVLKTANEEPSGRSLAAFLLGTIVSTSEGRLDPKYEKNPQQTALLEEHPALMKTLQRAWSASSFKEIRNLRATIARSWISYGF